MGTVNIFLGGTGKHIAEDIQDSRDFYGLSISEPVAFDLDGTRRSGVDLRGFVHPAQDAINSVGDVARRWAELEPGRELGPADDAPGPRTSPEHSVLVDVGKGIAENPAPTRGLYALRGHGLTVFSALFDSRLAIAGAGDGRRLRTLIANRVREARAEGSDGETRVNINLVTSTAGGTGAGTVIPLALWLRAEYPNAILTLLAVTPTAFVSVLKGNPNSAELAAKGRSGTYAMFRELSFLQGVDPQAQKGFSPRLLPATDKGLAYTPGQELFNRVYWFGGRGGNEPSDAFEEAGALLRILSADNTAEELHGRTGAHPLQSVGAVTAIEYPRLRLQRKLVSGVLVAAYERLRAARPTFVGGAPAAGAVSLLDYVDDATGRALGAWFSGQRFAALALDADHTPLGDAAADTLAERVRREASVEGYAAVPRGARIPGSNYDGGDAEWKAYQAQLLDGLRNVDQDNQRKLGDAIPAMRGGEERAFAEWLKGKVFDEWLSGGDGDRPDGVEDVRARLDRLERDARELERRVGDDAFVPGETVNEADDRINALANKLDKPDAVNVGLKWWQRLIGYGAAAGLFFAFVLGLSPVWDGVSRFGEFAGTSLSEILVWAGGAILAFLAFRSVRWFFLRSTENAASLRERRKDAEDRLFAACVERDRVRALRWLHEELRGRDGAPAFFRELRAQIESVQAYVSRLDQLYEGLRSEAAAEVANAAANPDHVRATVGDCLEGDQGIADSIVPDFARRLRVDARLDPDRRVCALAVRLEPLDGDDDHVLAASADVQDVLVAIDPDRGADVATDIANRWKDAVWGFVNWRLGENLPQDFDVALQRCEGGEDAATQALVDRLNRIGFPRRPSIDLRGDTDEPVFRQMYAGGAAIRARFNKALNHPGLDPAKRVALMHYAEDSKDVGALGEQLVFLDLWADDGGQHWAPHVIGNAVEADAALETYYAAARGAPPRATADQTCFTVIPELLAATKLELGGSVKPLAPAVVARLLGSDLDTEGPTYAELFHMLRARDCIAFDREGSGPDARTVVRLALDDRAIDLVDYPPGGIRDSLFGAGRERVIAFDAFCDFMRFDGTPVVHGQEDAGPFPGASLFKDRWASDPRGVARLQRAAVHQWYAGDVDDDCEDMVRVLEADLQDMRNGDREVRDSWERAMRRLLDGEERRAIRETWLRASNR